MRSTDNMNLGKEKDSVYSDILDIDSITLCMLWNHCTTELYSELTNVYSCALMVSERILRVQHL